MIDLLHYGDMLDATSIGALISEIKPHEVYNLAPSHVAVLKCLNTPLRLSLGTIRLLEAIRRGGLTNHTKFYQASTSELFGLVQQTPQNEQTPLYPASIWCI